MSKSFLINIIFQLSIYCYFAFIPFFEVEVQPYSSVFAVIYLLLFRFTFKIQFFVFLGIVSIYLLIAISSYINNNSYPIGGAVVSFLSFIVPLLIFCALYNNVRLISVNGFFITFYIWFVLGFLQNYFPMLLTNSGIEAFIQIFISRFKAGAVDSVRGITFFTAEPAGSSYAIMLFFIFLLYLHNIGKVNTKRFWASVTMVFVMILWNKSGTSLLLLMVFMVIYALFNAKPVFILFGALGSYLALLILQMDFVQDYRGLQLVSDTLKFVSDSNLGIIDYLNSTGSIREIGVIVGYNSVLQGHVWGLGLGSWKTEFLNEMMRQGFDPLSNPFFREVGMRDIKPASYVAAIAFDMGLIGILPILYLTQTVLKDIKLSFVKNKLGLSIVTYSIAMLLFHTLVSLPIFWITLCIGIDLIKKEN